MEGDLLGRLTGIRSRRVYSGCVQIRNGRIHDGLLYIGEPHNSIAAQPKMMGATDPEGSRVQPQSNTEPLEAYCRVAGASLLESLGNY